MLLLRVNSKFNEFRRTNESRIVLLQAEVWKVSRRVKYLNDGQSDLRFYCTKMDSFGHLALWLLVSRFMKYYT